MNIFYYFIVGDFYIFIFGLGMGFGILLFLLILDGVIYFGIIVMDVGDFYYGFGYF